ncbi:MAG: DUF2059 domain-containing protein [Pseudomonadota bacterium]
MRTLVLSAALSLWAAMGQASAVVDQLVEAMGIPALIQSFATEGVEAGETINQTVLNGQGGDIWAVTVQRLYDPARLEDELRRGMSATLSPEVAAQALAFFDSDMGQRIITLEVQARQAMMDDAVEAAAKQAAARAGADVGAFLDLRDLVDRNTDAAINAQAAFFDGLAETSGRAGDAPDFDAQRPAIATETESWLRGYYALVQSALQDDDFAVYTAFWDTEVGEAVDDAMFEAFGACYSALSYGLGQAAGRLMPQNEL